MKLVDFFMLWAASLVLVFILSEAVKEIRFAAESMCRIANAIERIEERGRK